MGFWCSVNLFITQWICEHPAIMEVMWILYIIVYLVQLDSSNKAVDIFSVTWAQSTSVQPEKASFCQRSPLPSSRKFLSESLVRCLGQRHPDQLLWWSVACLFTKGRVSRADIGRKALHAKFARGNTHVAKIPWTAAPHPSFYSWSVKPWPHVCTLPSRWTRTTRLAHTTAFAEERHSYFRVWILSGVSDGDSTPAIMKACNILLDLVNDSPQRTVIKDSLFWIHAACAMVLSWKSKISAESSFRTLLSTFSKRSDFRS